MRHTRWGSGTTHSILLLLLAFALLATPGTAAAATDVSVVTTASGSAQVTLEWQNPGGDHEGVLIVRSQGAPVSGAPTDGQTYLVGDPVGNGTVACVALAADTSCTVTGLDNATLQYFALFEFDSLSNYAPGVATEGFPRDPADVGSPPLIPSTAAKWAFHGTSAALAPIGAVPSSRLVGIGADGRLHRMQESNGTRGAWSPPLVGGSVQSRPMAGDINPAGPPTEVAFLSSQNGHLYRYSLADGAALGGDATVVTDAGCPAGILQAGPVAMIHAFDFDPQTNPNDDVVIQATRCDDVNGDGTLNDNKILMYSHDLATLYDVYGGPGTPLGISNATPQMVYRKQANNLTYIPLHGSAGGPSLIVVSVHFDRTFGVFAANPGLGDIDTTPEIFYSGNDSLLVVGNTNGDVYLLLAEQREGIAGTPLLLRGTVAGTDGPVKGLAASTAIDAGGGTAIHWVVWTTDTQIHGVQVANNATLSPGTWDISLSSASVPLVLRNVRTPGDVLAYVGSNLGRLYELDATTGTVTRSWILEPGTTVGDPTFDYNDGVHQGIVAGTSNGTYFWVPIN